jgi:opine dehydrogenase
MPHVIIRSDESNARLTALAFAGRGHTVSLSQTAGVASFDGTVTVFGESRAVTLVDPTSITSSESFIAVAFAEGEDVAAAVSGLLAQGTPELLIIVGGGISGATAAAGAARAAGLSLGKVAMTGGFAFGGGLGDEPSISSEKNGLLCAFLGEADETALALFHEMLPAANVVPLRVAGLSSNNALIHVPAMILNAMSIERGEPLHFYVEAYGHSVCRLVEALDTERLALGTSLGVDLPTFESILDRYYGREGMAGKNLHEKITTFPEYSGGLLPDSFEHRYLVHEIESTFSPMLSMLIAADLPHDSVAAVVRLAEILVGRSLRDNATSVAGEFLTL